MQGTDSISEWFLVHSYRWSMWKSGRHLVYGGITKARPLSEISPKTEFSVVARDFGVHGVEVNKVEDAAAALKKWSSAHDSACLDLILSDTPAHPMTEVVVGNVESENGIVVP